MWVDKEWRAREDGIQNYDCKQRFSVIKVEFEKYGQRVMEEMGVGDLKVGPEASREPLL